MKCQYVHDKKGLAWAWPVFEPEEVAGYSRDEVLANWYLLWGTAHCVKAPDYFGEFCVALINRAETLGFNLYEETDFFKRKVKTVTVPTANGIADGVKRVCESYAKFYGAAPN